MVVAVMLYLPVIFVRKVSPRSILRNRYRRLCGINWIIRCFGKQDEEETPNAEEHGELGEEQKISKEVAELQEYNAHVRERVWFWLLFW